MMFEGDIRSPQSMSKRWTKVLRRVLDALGTHGDPCVSLYEHFSLVKTPASVPAGRPFLFLVLDTLLST